MQHPSTLPPELRLRQVRSSRRWRKADSNRRSLPVNELVSRAGIRMRARRLGCSRKRLPCSRDHGFESAFLHRRVRCEPDSLVAHNARHIMLLTVKSAAAEDEQAVVALWHACDLAASYVIA